MKIDFFVPGVPVGKGRPRVYSNKYTGRVHGVTPKKTKDYEQHIKQCFTLAARSEGERFFTAEPLYLTLEVLMPLPDSWSKKKREAMRGQPHTSKPDLDNIIKAIADALNGVAYADDKQIFHIEAEKVYADSPERVGVWVEICEKKSENS